MILKCYPVCECGYVFKKLKCIENEKKLKGKYATVIVHGNTIFSPDKCPKCGKKIDGLEIDDFIKSEVEQ